MASTTFSDRASHFFPRASITHPATSQSISFSLSRIPRLQPHIRTPYASSKVFSRRSCHYFIFFYGFPLTSFDFHRSFSISHHLNHFPPFNLQLQPINQFHFTFPPLNRSDSLFPFNLAFPLHSAASSLVGEASRIQIALLLPPSVRTPPVLPSHMVVANGSLPRGSRLSHPIRVSDWERASLCAPTAALTVKDDEVSRWLGFQWVEDDSQLLGLRWRVLIG
ncbi:hypothetical protein LR48_Vigan05g083200 [Vigna angularis]|uniref:Uncharacterized protein n=1 Tax=Phaseolus angularis TaxID=3914 RepID=A0A0L9UKE0_PHAAN|nr:hypothetical protein LR48_Vigan05g083200 [Vigna angularis]